MKKIGILIAAISVLALASPAFANDHSLPKNSKACFGMDHGFKSKSWIKSYCYPGIPTVSKASYSRRPSGFNIPPKLTVSVSFTDFVRDTGCNPGDTWGIGAVDSSGNGSNSNEQFSSSVLSNTFRFSLYPNDDYIYVAFFCNQGTENEVQGNFLEGTGGETPKVIFSTH